MEHPPFESKYHAVSWYLRMARLHRVRASWNSRQADYYYNTGLAVARQNNVEDYFFEHLRYIEGEDSNEVQNLS